MTFICTKTNTCTITCSHHQPHTPKPDHRTRQRHVTCANTQCLGGTCVPVYLVTIKHERPL